MNIYEPKKELCKICNKTVAKLLPLCRIDDEVKQFPVCMECRENIPHEIIPVKTELSEGFVCVKNFDANKRILTKYGKKLLDND